MSFFGTVVVFKIKNLELYLLEFVQIRFAIHLNVRFNLGDHQYDNIKIFSQVNLCSHFCAYFYVIFLSYFLINFDTNQFKVILNFFLMGKHMSQAAKHCMQMCI